MNTGGTGKLNFQSERIIFFFRYVWGYATLGKDKYCKKKQNIKTSFIII